MKELYTKLAVKIVFYVLTIAPGRGMCLGHSLAQVGPRLSKRAKKSLKECLQIFKRPNNNVLLS